MSIKKPTQTHHSASVASATATGKRQSPTHAPSTLLQRAHANPAALSSTEVLQLQGMMGNRAVTKLLSTTSTAPVPLASPPTTPLLQRKKSHAEKYIATHSLTIAATAVAVKTYVDNATNPIEHRQGLLKAWNTKQNKTNLIATPVDLVPKGKEMADLEDFTGWDSENDDSLVLKDVIAKKRKRGVTLVRGDGRVLSDRPLLSMPDVVRIARQIVKRNDYDLLPFVAQIGPLYIEYDNPGTSDIYATPLEAQKQADHFKRAGTSSDYNFDNLTKHLDEESSEPDKKKTKLENVLKPFTGKSGGELSKSEAEAVAAISCDFMKGSGAIDFVKEAESHAEKAKSGFSAFFRGDKPHYLPAKTGGRKLVTEKTIANRKARMAKYGGEVNHLIGVNNCLINAIAQAGLHRDATLAELVRIRRALGNVGEMMAATPNTVRVITQVLGLQRDITVYHDITRGAQPNETIGTYGGAALRIFHTDGNHFVHVCPDETNYDLGG